MIAPAVPELSARFNITNGKSLTPSKRRTRLTPFRLLDVIQSMVVSIFVLAYAIGPLVLGPLSEIYGRTIVLQLANLVYLGECARPLTSPPAVLTSTHGQCSTLYADLRPTQDRC